MPRHARRGLLGSQESVVDDLRLVRSRGGFLRCEARDLDGTVARLRDVGCTQPDLVAAAIDLHLEVGRRVFAEFGDRPHMGDRRRIGALVLEPGMYAEDNLPEGIAGLRKSTIKDYSVGVSTLVDWENLVLDDLAALVYRQARQFVATSAENPLTYEQRQLLRRAQRHLSLLIYSAIPTIVGRPSEDDRALSCLWDYLSFIDCVAAQSDAGAEAPFLRLGGEFAFTQPGAELEGQRFTDNDDLNYMVGIMMGYRTPQFLQAYELERICRVTRSVQRWDTGSVQRAIEAIPGGTLTIERWRALLAMCDDDCLQPSSFDDSASPSCLAHEFLYCVRFLEHSFTEALEFRGSAADALKRREREEAAERDVDVLDVLDIDRQSHLDLQRAMDAPATTEFVEAARSSVDEDVDGPYRDDVLITSPRVAFRLGTNRQVPATGAEAFASSSSFSFVDLRGIVADEASDA